MKPYIRLWKINTFLLFNCLKGMRKWSTPVRSPLLYIAFILSEIYMTLVLPFAIVLSRWIGYRAYPAPPLGVTKLLCQITIPRKQYK